VDWGSASRAFQGQPASGDLALVLPFANGVLIAALDGVGHGDEAAKAARTAGEVLRAQPDETVVRLIERCHEALLETRGVVMSLASFDASEGRLAWAGVGNVEGRLLRGRAGPLPCCESLLLRGGVVGFNLPPLGASLLAIEPGDTLLFATDGVRSGFANALTAARTPRQLAESILDQHAKATDDALALVAVFRGPQA
jgi:hypothetical protein